MNERGYWRGDIFFANLGKRVGSEQCGLRPVVILQNNTGNRYAPTVIVAPITSHPKKQHQPTHVPLNSIPGIINSVRSQILLEQITTIDKSRLQNYCGHIAQEVQDRVNDALRCSLDI